MSSLVTNSTGNCKLGHDCRRVRSHRRHYAARLPCWQICSDSSKLSPTSCEFRPPRRRDSTRQLSGVGVGGVYWAYLRGWSIDKRWFSGDQQDHVQLQFRPNSTCVAQGCRRAAAGIQGQQHADQQSRLPQGSRSVLSVLH